jgi:uncharacterized phage infection (PIP) family protein YhgE
MNVRLISLSLEVNRLSISSILAVQVTNLYSVGFFSVEKLPDFADDKKEEKDEEEKANSDVEQEGEEPAGHDRQDTNQAEECKSKPMTTEQEDEKPNEQNEDKGTEFDGLQVSSSLPFKFMINIVNSLIPNSWNHLNTKLFRVWLSYGNFYSKTGPDLKFIKLCISLDC